MILNVSYNNKKITKQIEAEVGPPFTLKERWKKKGIGSTKLIITNASISIQNLLLLDNNRNQCNIELRPKGIIVGFRSLLESYALVIPYYQLALYKATAETYSIYRNTYFITIEAKPNDKRVHQFIQKILNEKAAQTHLRPDEI